MIYYVLQVTEALTNHGVEKEEIGIITPYNAQANLIRQVLNMTVVEVHTIDKYQVKLALFYILCSFSLFN